MENEKVTTAKTSKPKKKFNEAAANTNLKFGMIALFSICAILIGVGLTLAIAFKAYLGGIMLMFFGVAFAIINVVLNKTIFTNKKVDNSDEKTTKQ